MSRLSGKIPEDNMEIVEELVENGDYDSKAEFVRFATRYTLSEKHRR